MSAIVIYKTKYGATKTYAEWIAEELSCEIADVKKIKPKALETYDTVIYGGGLYAEVINGVSLITKNQDILKNKKVIVYTTGLTPINCREYYDKTVMEKNFGTDKPENIRVFNFLGKMIMNELTPVHRGAIKTLKKIMSAKQNPTELERLLIELCDADGDFTDKKYIAELVKYAKE